VIITSGVIGVRAGSFYLNEARSFAVILREADMQNFQVQTVETAPEGSKPALEQLQETFGIIPNIAGVIANSPDLANVFVKLFQGVHGGTLTEADIQTLLLTNAVTNASLWAVAFHSALSLGEGISAEDVRAIRERRAPADPRHAALSNFARSLIEKRGHVDEGDLEQFVAGGLRKDQALEVLAVSAASTITNYAGSLAQPPLEPMFQEHAWVG
jgi:alkylhydroperoxidase family enzyme